MKTLDTSDPKTGTGAFVRPRPGRLILMDQDVSHRVSAPSPLVQKPLLYPPHHTLLLLSFSPFSPTLYSSPSPLPPFLARYPHDIFYRTRTF